MIPRYTTPEMAELWSERTKLATWLEVELLTVEAQAAWGLIPQEVASRLRARARVPDPERVREVERRTRHDVVAFLEVLSQDLGDDARYLHRGLGSSDVVDTATAVLLVRATDLLLQELDRVLEGLASLADRYRNALMPGRTHGMVAEPTTFGLKVGSWLAEMRRNRERLERARETVRVGKLSGEVGNYAHLGPWAEAYVCERLGLVPETVSTQIVSRDRHAELLCAIAITAGTLERIATEIRNLQRTEIHEVEEPFEAGQTGSSAMPHKRNPILCERITGLARMLRGMSLVALENEALWGERDISHSSNERLTLPGATTLLHYALRQLRYVLENLRVYPENMRRNLGRTGGLVYSHRVLLRLVERGMPREEAYRALQRAAFRVEEEAHRTPDAFLRALLEDPAIRPHADEETLRSCFDPVPYLAHVDEILRRVGIPPTGEGAP
ncbi:MAG: adenylosuccinate lyase [Armatimonadota bacterium]|nr:adenylosuccinate lyase [Armatimonadota bacterium]MDR7438765.1 adenylosuccinate lyase [Armatimonadota bacterium]MDR7561981.1 adenylosuccinate lyase [Armatimonadota bacterium]MDR7566928.1 adenylosuccinate lyase [Armatimonadota bacterium]MDR7602580.1 adenylosuccinate lyase [Armatimonadota bacterium]